MGDSLVLRVRDYVLLVALAGVLFGYGAISGKALTMHEARLPQCAREMMAAGEWFFPHSDGRPWLERPPLPHWVMIAAGHVLGGMDRVWVARIPPALMGLAGVLMAAWMGARLFGREMGVLSGVALATMYEFYFYAGQAEDDIFLAAVVTACYAFFVASEFTSRREDGRVNPVGLRTWPVWGFFVVLGLTNLAKGPLVGAAEVIGATGAFLLLTGRARRIFRYVWVWGWVVFAAIGVAWPVAAYRAYPSIWDNWMWDFHAGKFGQQPAWYYFVNLLWTAAPWTPVMLIGLAATWRGARQKADGPERFLWCYAMVPLIVLSLPSRKHHHYLLPVLPAWAMLAALGARQVAGFLFREKPKANTVLIGLLGIALPGLVGLIVAMVMGKVPGDLGWKTALCVGWLICGIGVTVGLARQKGTWIVGSMVAGLVVFCAYGQSVLAVADENRWGDVALIQRVQKEVPADGLLMIEAQASLDFFRFQFYSRPEARLLHNVTFLRDERIDRPEVYVIARFGRRHFIEKEIGECRVVDQSSRTRKEESVEDRWTLFLVKFKADLKRCPAPTINVLQAIYRGTGDQAGPYCGPGMDEHIAPTGIE